MIAVCSYVQYFADVLTFDILLKTSKYILPEYGPAE